MCTVASAPAVFRVLDGGVSAVGWTQGHNNVMEER
jgi:hypothetical protein